MQKDIKFNISHLHMIYNRVLHLFFFYKLITKLRECCKYSVRRNCYNFWDKSMRYTIKQQPKPKKGTGFIA